MVWQSFELTSLRTIAARSADREARSPTERFSEKFRSRITLIRTFFAIGYRFFGLESSWLGLLMAIETPLSPMPRSVSAPLRQFCT